MPKKLRLSIIFDVEGQTVTDYLLFLPTTDVGTALAIIRSHFMQKYYSKGNKGSSPKERDTNGECVALWSYEACQSDELTFSEGDVIEVYAKPHEDWWRGEIDGVRGLFPSCYVQEISQLQEKDSRETQTLREIHDPECYGLYMPPPLDEWLQQDKKLSAYGLVDFQCVKYTRLPSSGRPKQNSLTRSGSGTSDRGDPGTKAAAARRDDIENALRLFAGSGNLTIDIFVREIGQSCSLEMSDVVLAKDVLALLAKQLKGKPLPGFQQEEIRLKDYGLVCLPRDPKVTDTYGVLIPFDHQIRSFANKGKIELHRLYLHLKIEIEPPPTEDPRFPHLFPSSSSDLPLSHIYLSFRSESKISLVIDQLLSLYPSLAMQSKCESFELFLVNGSHPKKQTTLRLVRERTLRSYRLTEIQNELKFAPETSVSEIPDKIFLVVKAPALNLSKTLSLDTSLSIGEVMMDFVRRVNMVVPSNKVLELYHEQSAEPLHPMRQLKNLNILPKDTLILVSKTASKESKRKIQRKKSEPQDWEGMLHHPALGIEVSAFKMTPMEKSGVLVPAFLLRLGEAMDRTNVYLSPEIVEPDDSENFGEVCRLFDQLCPFGEMTCPSPKFAFGEKSHLHLTQSDGEERRGEDTYQPNVASALLRHWLYRLPKRFLDYLPLPQLQYVSKNEAENCEEVFGYLPVHASGIFMWVLQFCARIQSHSHINHLTSHQIAAFMSPCLISVQGTAKFGMDSQQVVEGSKVIWDVITRLIDNRVVKTAPEEEVVVAPEKEVRIEKSKSSSWLKVGALRKKSKSFAKDDVLDLSELK